MKNQKQKKKLKMRQYIIKADEAANIKGRQGSVYRRKGGLTYDCSETDHWG